MERVFSVLGRLVSSRAVEVIVLSTFSALFAVTYSHSGYAVLRGENLLPCVGGEENDTCYNDVELRAKQFDGGYSMTWLMVLLLTSRVLLSMAAQINLFVSFKWYQRLGYDITLGSIVVFCLLLSTVFSLFIFWPSSFYGIELVAYLAVRRATKWCNLFLETVHRPPQHSAEASDHLSRAMGEIGASFLLSTTRSTLIIGFGVYMVEPFSSLCSLACITSLVVLVVFFTVFPACYSLCTNFTAVSPLTSSPGRLPPQKSSDDGVSQIQFVMMLGLLVVHARTLLMANDGHNTWREMMWSPEMTVMVLLHQSPWWNYLCYFLQWCATAVLFGLLREGTVVDSLCRYFGLVSDKRVSFIGCTTSNVATSSDCNTMNTSKTSQLYDSVFTGSANDSERPACLPVDCAAAQTGAEHIHESLSDQTSSSSDVTDGPCVSRCNSQGADAIQPSAGDRPLFSIAGPVSTEGGIDSGSCADPEPPTSGIVSAADASTEPSAQPMALPPPIRSMEECQAILAEDASKLSNNEVLLLVRSGKIAGHRLETLLGDLERAVLIRRLALDEKLATSGFAGALQHLPSTSYNYSEVFGCCCENVIGYVPIPVGVAGPLHLDGNQYTLPLATTEGCLVASTNRGCRALQKSGGVTSCLVGDGMSRAPVVQFTSVLEASAAKAWCEDSEHFHRLKSEFDSTSRFARLQSIHGAVAGNCMHLRFSATTGDAMGMNMVSKGVEKCLRLLSAEFPNMSVRSLSGNYCTDKKPSAVNWVLGRGKSVVCEATLPGSVVREVLKTTPQQVAQLNVSKNLVGSAMAGSVGGYNAHAANIVTAMFMATGQDVAQSGTSSVCLTQMEVVPCFDGDDVMVDGDDAFSLHVTCTMPCLEVGTVGGGTNLSAQQACLKMLGVNGAHRLSPGTNSAQLARIICAAVMAGELSLMAALTTGDLVRSHLKHNRSVSSAALASFTSAGGGGAP